jgi:pectinesterase
MSRTVAVQDLALVLRPFASSSSMINGRRLCVMTTVVLTTWILGSGCAGAGATHDVPAVTDVRFVEPREDLAWENDRIAFRVYGPALAAEVSNGIDVWSKRVSYPVIEKWYAGDAATGPAKRSYHVDHGEGADFFSVGRTLGCGGSSIRDGDSLIQPGVFASYRIMSTGPKLAEFELTYPPVMFRGRAVRESRRVALPAGDHLNRIDVTYSVEGDPIDVPFAIGLVKRKGVLVTRNPADHSISIWGPMNDDPVNGELGMGAVLPGSAFRKISEDATHVLLHGEIRSGVPVTYYAGAGWTRNGRISVKADWESILRRTSESFESHP